MQNDSLVLANEIDLTIFVACYNEEDNIVDTLETILGAMQELNYSYEILVIDDASTDDSVTVTRAYLGKNPDVPARLFLRDINQGLAQNFIEGAFLGRGKYYRLVCGDSVQSKEELIQIFRHIGEADILIPYMVKVPGKNRFRQGLSRMFTLLINFISGYNLRYYNGCAVYLRYDVMRWHTNYYGFGFQADLMTRLLDLGASYVEIASSATERSAGKSKALTLTNLLSVAHTVLDLFIRRFASILYKRRKIVRCRMMD